MVRYSSAIVLILLIAKWGTYSHSQDLPPEQICDQAQDNCRKCLLASPLCSWCSAHNFTSSRRCRLASVNQPPCSKGFLENPQGTWNDTRNDPFTNITDYNEESLNVQLRPQEFKIRLRQGQSQRINLTFKRVIDYPLDLYYVMDLSYSMQDDLETLQSLGDSLAGNIQSITNNVRLGFGTFVDKVMMPFASTVPDQLLDPCLNSDDESCAPVFGFRHQLPITANGSAFKEAVQKTNISGNIDTPEGGFDALMQIAVCQKQVEWRKEALRVILFTTDASSHIAMDGKLAAILEINDMQCHLQKGFNKYLEADAIVYSKSKEQDYPSIGQLKKAFTDNNIQAIFAVTNDVKPLYQDMEKLLQNTFVRALNNDSSNVVQVINETYAVLRSKIQLTPPIPPSNIEVRYRVKCPDREWEEDSLQCDNVNIGNEAVFEFEVSAKGCPSTAGRVDTMNITSGSIVDTAIFRIEYVSCECNCFEDREEKSEACNGRGTYECGKCLCEPGSSGASCQCTGATSGQSLEANCTREEYTPGVDLCSLHGTCKCGTCNCEDGYFGGYCQCRHTGCPGNNCGGPEKGTCFNCDNDQRCDCKTDNGWTINNVTRDCTCNLKLCRPDEADSGPVCNGNGECECNQCNCKSMFIGTHCNTCTHPECTGLGGDCSSEALRECAECVYEQERKSTTAVTTACADKCHDKDISIEPRDELLDCNTCKDADCSKACNQFSFDPSVHIPVECSSTSDDTGCNFAYKIFWNTKSNRFVIYVRNFDRERDCPGPPDPLLIVLPVVGGIVLIGLIALILWKIFQTIRDKMEYEQFLEDTKHSQWSKGENPLFHKPTDRIINPAFVGSE